MCVFFPPSTPTLHTLKHFVGIGRDKGGVRGGGGGTSWSPCICEKGGVYTSGAPSFPGPSKSRRRGQGGWLEEGLSYRCGTRREGDPRQAEWSRQCAHSGKRGAALPERDGGKKKNLQLAIGEKSPTEGTVCDSGQTRMLRSGPRVPSVRYVISLPSFFRLYTNG